MGGEKNNRLSEAIQNYYYLFQAFNNMSKFSAKYGKSRFYWSFLSILKQNNLISDDELLSEMDNSDTSQRSKRDITNINSEKSAGVRSDQSHSEGSLPKRRRLRRE